MGTLRSSTRALPSLGKNELHVWRLRIQAGSGELAHLCAWLEPSELESANRFLRRADAARFVAARALVRLVLGGYLGVEPGALELRSGGGRKPELAASGAELRFNLSHSGDGVLLGVALAREVGVDLELVRDVRALELARRFFAAREVEDLHGLGGEALVHAFHRTWTRKEAYLKAVGIGLAAPLDAFEIPRSPERVHVRGVAPSPRGPWTVESFDAFPGYASAACAEGDDWSLHCWDAPEFLGERA